MLPDKFGNLFLISYNDVFSIIFVELEPLLLKYGLTFLQNSLLSATFLHLIWQNIVFFFVFLKTFRQKFGLCLYFCQLNTAWKVSVFGVILVRIFPHLDWIRRDFRISPYSVQIKENADQSNSECGHFLCSENGSYLY